MMRVTLAGDLRRHPITRNARLRGVLRRRTHELILFLRRLRGRSRSTAKRRIKSERTGRVQGIQLNIQLPAM
jgi:hypothetical protein